MNKYSDILKITDDERYLISMVSVKQLLRLGMELGLNKDSRVLDLCCGYGTVLKIWNEAFGGDFRLGKKRESTICNNC